MPNCSLRNNLGYISFYFGCFISLYSKLIGWVMEEREYAAAGGGSSFIGNCNPYVTEVLYVVP